MKRLILTVFAVLLILSSWAQSAKDLSECTMQIRHEVSAPSCLNGMDGKIKLKISGAKKPYAIQWADQGQGEERAGIPAGLYVVTVKDVDGCIKKKEFEVPHGKALLGNLIIKQLSSATGRIRLIVSFPEGEVPAAIQIKNLSKGVQAPWLPYKGEELVKGLYLVEAYNKAGCNQIEKIDLRNQ